MLDNFAYLIDQVGFIPNGNRSYFLTRSQPPFFASMVMAYAKKEGLNPAINYLPHLEKEYSFWMEGKEKLSTKNQVFKRVVRMPDGSTLNRYFGSLDSVGIPLPRAEAHPKETKWAKLLPEESRPEFYRNLRAACESGWDFSSRWFKGDSIQTIETLSCLELIVFSLFF